MEKEGKNETLKVYVSISQCGIHRIKPVHHRIHFDQ